MNREEKMGSIFGWSFVFCILITVSVTLGYLGTKRYIIPHFVKYETVKKVDATAKEVFEEKKEVEQAEKEVNVKEEKKKDHEKTTEPAYVRTLELKGFDMFSVQVGSFSTKENAQELVDQLGENEMGAFIWHNETYKVMCSSSLDRKTIDEMMPNIKEKYAEAFVVKRSIATKAIRYSENDSEYSVLLGTQNEKFIEVLEEVSEIIKKSENKEKSNGLIKKQLGNLKSIKTLLEKGKPSEEMKSTNDAFVEIVGGFTKELEEYLKGESKSLVSIQNTFMKTLYEYSDFAAEAKS